jgi:hypothetical protein
MSRQLRIADPELVRRADAADEVYFGKKLYVSVVFDDHIAGAKLTPDEVVRVNQALADTRPSLNADEVSSTFAYEARSLG